MNFFLRGNNPADFETLWQIDQQCFLPGIAYSKADLATFLQRKGAFCIVAEESPALAPTAEAPNIVTTETTITSAAPAAMNPLIVGYLIVNIHARQQVAHVITLDVLPRARRSGVGSKMMATAENRCKDLSCKAIHLEAAVNNIAALEFYQRHGYAIVGDVPNYYADGADAYSLTKPLI